MKASLVSVIVICYNHEKYVEQAIQSVLDQDYDNIEIIVADDASDDHSIDKIKDLNAIHPGIIVLENEQNIGNCSTFNRAFKVSGGEYIVDLSADDILEPTRISKGVNLLQSRGSDYGVHYTDAWMIDENSKLLGVHSNSTKRIKKDPFPEGDLFARLLERYFICPPSLMAKRVVYETLNGYDEQLSYEDFDFLIRSSRSYNYCVSPEPLVIKRILDSSKSSRQSSKQKYYESTLAVCKKAFQIVKSDQEKQALVVRSLFEARQALKRGQIHVVEGFLEIMHQLGVSKWKLLIYRLLMKFY